MGYRGLQGFTRDYRGLQRVTRVKGFYRWLTGYKGLQGVHGVRGGVTDGYKG